MSEQPGNHAPDADDDAGATKQAIRKLQLVRAGASQFGVFADEIATIVAWRQPTPLPQAPKPVLGVVSVQGRMLTVLDLALLADGETAHSDSRGEAAGEAPGTAAQKESDAFHGHLVALRGDEQLALAVADVGESIELDGYAAQPENGKLVLGVLQRDGAQINVLNLKELFPTAIQGRERRRRRF
jgi:chemotaxis signal transduction protein